MSKLPATGMPHENAVEAVPHGPHQDRIQGDCGALQWSTDIEYQTDAMGRWVRLSSSWTDVMGHDVNDVLGTPFQNYIHPEDRVRSAALKQPLARCTAHERCGSRDSCRSNDIRFVARDGSTRWIQVFGQVVLDGHGAIVAAAGRLVDVTQRRHIEERLRLTARVFDGTCDGVVITDAQARIVDVNDAFTAITGYTREQVLGRNPSLLASGRHDCAFYKAMWKRLREEGRWSGELWNRRADGKLVAEEMRISAVHSDCGDLTHYVGIFSDTTPAKRQQEHHAWLAHHDALTGLPNRALALERLGQLMVGARRSGGQVAVCCLDLDGFAGINDRIGHERGDALLVALAEQMGHAVRACDTVARLDGDEFVVLLQAVEGMASVQATIDRVQQALTHPNVLAEAKLAVTASIGVALFPDHGSTAEQLLRMADLAVYRAKQLGRNRTCVAGEPLARMPGQDLLAGELQGALASNQLCLYYQPKVCARTYRALGVEALVRWQHPQRGLLAPGAFLPAIVGTPLEVALDLWVLRTAMTQLARWRTAGRDLHVAINISPGTLVLPDLASRVTGIVHETVAQHLVPLDGIELEVLETAALQDLGVAGHAIEACAAQGISFALDDFGTGYSSLAYLRRLPVRTLKIDRSFVSGMLANPGDMHIVRAVIGLAEAFGVTTVAEGVETHEHARVLAELGCHQLQGYWIGKPMPELALQAWLEAQPRMLQQYVLPAAQRSGEVTA